MSKPLSLDLRQRIIDAVNERSRTYEEIAEDLSVGTASIKRLVRLVRDTGSIEPRPHGGGRSPRSKKMIWK